MYKYEIIRVLTSALCDKFSVLRKENPSDLLDNTDN